MLIDIINQDYLARDMDINIIAAIIAELMFIPFEIINVNITGIVQINKIESKAGVLKTRVWSPTEAKLIEANINTDTFTKFYKTTNPYNDTE